MKIIEKGQGVPDAQAIADGQTMIEILVPGNKVGLVIGKGGETIKQLQVSRIEDNKREGRAVRQGMEKGEG